MPPADADRVYRLGRVVYDHSLTRPAGGTVTEHSPMHGYSLSELELPANAELLAFGKAGEPVDIPDDDVSMTVGDRLIVLADFTALSDVRHIIVGEPGRAALGGA